MGDLIRSVRGYGCPPGFPDGWGLAPLETSFPGLPLFDGPNPLGAIRSSSSSRRSLSTFMGPLLQRVVRREVLRRRGSWPRRNPPAGAFVAGVVRVVVGRVVVPRVSRAAGGDPLLRLLESQLEDPHDSTSTKGDVPSVRPVRPKYGEDRERRARTGDHPADHNPLLVGHLWEWRRARDLRVCPELRHGRAVGCVSVRRGAGRRAWLGRVTPPRGRGGFSPGGGGGSPATPAASQIRAIVSPILLLGVEAPAVIPIVATPSSHPVITTSSLAPIGRCRSAPPAPFAPVPGSTHPASSMW